MVKKDFKMCACSGGFPTFAVIVLILAVLWFLTDLGVIAVSIPWVPLIVIIIALGWIVNHGRKK